MGTYTDNLGLYKPAAHEDSVAALVGANFDILDARAPKYGTDEIALAKASGTVTLDGTTTPIWLPLQVISDPNGWIVSGSYTSPAYSDTVPANSSVNLPEGLYAVSIDSNISADTGSGKFVAIYADFIDFPTSDPVYASPGYFFGPAHGANDSTPGGLGNWSTYVVASGVYRQTATMAAGPTRIGVHAFQNSGSSRTVSFSDVWIRRLA